MRSLLAFALLASMTLSASAQALVWPDVPERIERGLLSPDAGSRRSAARELVTLSPGRAEPLVLKALGDPDVEVRLSAAHSAIRLHVASAADAAVPWLGERDPRLRAAACDLALAMPNPRAVPALARALGDGDAQVRSSCADALGGQGSTEAVAPLSGKLDDPAPNVRAQVARALARLGDPRAVVPLVGKVQDSVAEVRQAVVRALGELGDPRATQALLLSLRDNVAEVKIEGLGALARLRAADAAASVAPLTTERNPSVRQAAIAALGRIGNADAVRALVRCLGVQEDATGTLERTPVRDALVAAGSAAVTELTALLGRPIPPAVATSAAGVLGELRANASAPAIVSALRKGVLPPAAALRSLSGAGNAESVPVVLEFVADPSPVVRAEALRAATSLLDPTRPDGRAVEPLAATLRDARTSPAERASVATLLGRTGAPRAARELAGLVASKDSSLRIAAIDALGALGSESEVVDDALLALLSDSDAAVRLHAAVALSASGGAKAKSALVRKLDGGEEADRFALFTALGGVLERHSDDASATRVLRELPVAGGPERDAVIEAAGRAKLRVVVRALGSIAKSGTADDRRAAASALAAHPGDGEALAIVRALLADPDPSVQAQAAFTLGTIGDASTVGSLGALARAGHADVATNAAGGIARLAERSGKAVAAAVVAAVCPILADGRPHVRANALTALALASARCGDGRTERALLTEDASDLVRASAARVLRFAKGREDQAALERCASSERSAEVALLCRSQAPPPARPANKTHAVTVYVFGDAGSTPKPHAPFLLEYEGGVVRAGVADRRGAAFDPAAPAGGIRLRRSPKR